jgi:hypothetical protein
MNRLSMVARRALGSAALALAAGCASVAQTPVVLQPVPAAPAVMTLAQPLSLALDTGFHRDIAAGSRWQLAGRIAQGDVYQAVGNVFTVEGAHIHEAYLVVDNQAVVGFYLPAERGFSPLKQHSAISLQ